MEAPAYYSILTPEVRYSKSISDFEKLLYSDITCLTNKRGVCTASNNYFAQAFNKSDRTVSRGISNLEQEGFITTRLIYKDDSKEVAFREIYLSTKTSIPLDKNVHTPLDKNVYTPIDKNGEDNTTSNNITSNNNKKINKKTKSLDDAIQEKISSYSNINLNALNEWLDTKKFKSIAPVTKTLNFLSGYDLQTQQRIIDASIMNGWQGLFAPKQQSQATQAVSFKQQDAQRTDYAIDAFLEARANGFDLRNPDSYAVAGNSYEDVEVLECN